MWLQYFYIFWHLFYGLTYGLSWRMFFVHLRRMCVVLLLDGVFTMNMLGLVGLQYCSSSVCPYLSYICMVCPYWKRGIEVSNCYCRTVSSVLSTFHVFWALLFGGICFCKCSASWMNWSFYKCIMSFFVSSNSFWPKLYFVQYLYSHSAVFWILFA